MAADTAEVHVGTEAAEGAGDLLPQFMHPQIAFRKIVVEGDLAVAHEGQDVLGVVPEAI